MTIRGLLTRDAYIGRTVYQRLKRIRSRNGRAKSIVIQRPREEWIEIEGATPRIIDDLTWQHVQDILEDPERIRRKPEGRNYLLGSRIRCGVCGSAMVGQTLTNRGNPYRYYRCRHAYSKNTAFECSSRYVPAGPLEEAVKAEIVRVLSHPDVVATELAASHEQDGGATEFEIAKTEKELSAVEQRERKLLQLFMVEDLSEDAIREEAANLGRQKKALEEKLASLRVKVAPVLEVQDMDHLKRICAAIECWLADASDEQWSLVFEALQVSVEATRETATARGILPYEAPKFVTIGQTSACSFQSDKHSGLAFGSETLVCR